MPVNSEYSVELTKLFVANPVPLPYSDAYMAFKQGLYQFNHLAPNGNFLYTSII